MERKTATIYSAGMTPSILGWFSPDHILQRNVLLQKKLQMRHSQIVFSFYNSTSCRWQHSLHNAPELSFTKLSFWQSNTRSWFGEKSRSGIRTHTKPQTNKPTQEKTLQQNKIFKKSRKCSKYQWEPHWTAMGQVCPVRQSRLKQDFWAVRSIFPLTAQNCSCKLESKGKCVEEPVVAFAVPYWLLDRQGLAEQLCEAQESWVPQVMALKPLQRHLTPL